MQAVGGLYDADRGTAVIVIWIVALVVGIGVAALGSRRAVAGAVTIAESLGVSHGIVGVTLVAIGTDLPEIASSISASITGHGDINVGNATGSTLTQITLVLAIVMLASPSGALRERTPSDAERDVVVPVGSATVAATLLIAILISDREFSRTDGIVLVAVWVVSMALLARFSEPPRVQDGEGRDLATAAASSLGWLAVVGGAAALIVRSFVEITDAFGIPELVASTIVLALGTSLPELVVDWTAVRRGAVALAIGDLFGSSLVDASLSIGIGPAIRPTVVSGDAVATTLVVAVGVAMATWIARPRITPARRLPAALLAVYVACTATMLALAAV